MCGRFSLRARLAELLEHFLLEGENMPLFTARFNIAPTQPILAIRAKPEGKRPAREAVLLRWGLIPEWAADPGIGNKLINARSETAAQKPTFRASLRRRRCLIAADGFYEWKTEGRTKQPFFIHFSDDRPFAFAGLWDRWEGPDHSAVESCTILTTGANELMKPIHERMPAILEPKHYEKWLDPAEQDAAQVLPLLKPCSDQGLEAYPVGREVNSPSHEGPDCLTPSKMPKSLFD